MKGYRIFFLAAALLGVALSSCTQAEVLPPVVLPAPTQALATSVRGDALVYRNGQWEDILPGDLLGQGDVIRVAARSSLELQFGTTAVLRLQEETLLTLNLVELGKEAARIDTELAGGQVLAKVNQLAGGTNLSIRTGSVTMGVRGTEFLVRRRGDTVGTAVSTGKVEIAAPQGSVVVEGGQETTAYLAAVQVAQSQPLAETSRETLAAVSQLDFLPLDEEALILVRFLVRTLPSDADIVMGDRVMGRGTWGGVIKAGNELELRVEKGGYAPQALTVKAEEGVNPVYVVELSPLSPDQTLAPGVQQGPTAEELLRLQEATLAALRTRAQDVEGELQRATRREVELQERLEIIAQEAADLNSRLTQSTQERTDLQRQLTAATTERDRALRDLETARRDLATSRTQYNNLLAAREAEQAATNEIIRQLRAEAAANQAANP